MSNCIDTDSSKTDNGSDDDAASLSKGLLPDAHTKGHTKSLSLGNETSHDSSIFSSRSSISSDSTNHNRAIDQRYQTRFSHLTSIRNASNASDVSHLVESHEATNVKDPIRWTKLRKVCSQIYSEAAISSYGSPNCLLAATSIAIGTSKGMVLVFDYHQNLKAVLGPKTNAMRCGEVTSLAFSYDFRYLAVGHCNGHIFTWELKDPSTYDIHVHAITSGALHRACGHLVGTKVIHLAFIGKHRTTLVSGDVAGMAFAHNTIRTFIGRVVQTQRIMGRYPQLPIQRHNINEPEIKPTTLLACAPLPHVAENGSTGDICVVAILTPNLLALILAYPTPRTEFKTGRPKTVSNAMGLSGCLAWFPPLRAKNPRLAYCWSNILTIMEVVVSKTNDEVMINVKTPKRFTGEEAIVSIQWLSDKVR